jgi:hypothetical protein
VLAVVAQTRHIDSLLAQIDKEEAEKVGIIAFDGMYIREVSQTC